MAKIGIIKLDDGTTVDVYEVTDSPSSPLRVGTSSGAGVIPTSDTGNLPVKVNTSSGVKRLHRPTTQTTTFSYSTNSVQTWTAPETLIGTVSISVLGAGGGGSWSEDGSLGADGRPGGRVDADVTLNPGETLYIYAPQGGQGATSSHGSGGWGAHNGNGGGGAGESATGGGGGSAEVRIGSDSDTSAILSGGGGESGDAPYEYGGEGGQHSNEGGQSAGTGLVIDGSRVVSSTITSGGGGAGGDGRTGGGARAGRGGSGSVVLNYVA